MPLGPGRPALDSPVRQRWRSTCASSQRASRCRSITKPQHPSSRPHPQWVKADQQQQQSHLGDFLAQSDEAADSKTTVTGLPVPPASSQLTNPELESKLFSCGDVARELNYQESTIRRCAKKSWLCGPGPYPLRGIPSFYVVTRPNPACGRGHGCKF